MTDSPAGMRRPLNPKRDAELSERFRAWLLAIKPPRKLVDGVRLSHPIDWPGWPKVQVDVRFLR